MITEASQYGPVEYYGFDLFGPCPESEMPKSKMAPPIGRVQAKLEQVIAGRPATVRLFKGNSRETLPEAELPPMDLIFIDGGHSVETIKSDWIHCWRLMHAKTVLFFDDYYKDRPTAGCKTIIEEIMKTGQYHVEILDTPEPDHFNAAATRMVRVTRKSQGPEWPLGSLSETTQELAPSDFSPK